MIMLASAYCRENPNSVSFCFGPATRPLARLRFSQRLQEMQNQADERQGGGIEPLHVSMPQELKSCPSTSPTHPGSREMLKIALVIHCLKENCILQFPSGKASRFVKALLREASELRRLHNARRRCKQTSWTSATTCGEHALHIRINRKHDSTTIHPSTTIFRHWDLNPGPI